MKKRAPRRSLKAFVRRGLGPVRDLALRGESTKRTLQGPGEHGRPSPSLSVPDTASHYYFADKVYAGARAEELANGRTRSLIWVDIGCLIIRTPLLFDLDQ